MLQVGDRVKYKDNQGTVQSVLDDMVIVRLSDGKDYSLPYDALTKEGSGVVGPQEMGGLIEALKPHLKNVNFWNDIAKEASRAGVSELSLTNGIVSKFSAKESLEERIDRYTKSAMAEAKKKAEQDHAAESR